MILLGFKLLPDPNAEEIRSLFEEQTFIERGSKWSDLCEAHDVSVHDTEWVQAVGAFKTAHTWVGAASCPYPFMVSPNATSGFTGGKTVLC